MSNETPASDDIISDLHNALESATQKNCTCGSNPEISCKHCGQWTRAMNKACSAIGEIEIENTKLRARVAELEKAVGAANRMIHRKYQSGDEELILAAMKGQQ